MNEKEKILAYTFEIIIKEGIRRTTIEKLARDMGIGKNKIYTYFPTKDVLLKKSFIYITKGIRKQISTVFENKDNAIQKLVNWFNVLSVQIMRFNQKFLIDVQIHYPEVWISIDKFRKEMAYEVVTKLIEQGKKEKLFVDFPTEILVTIFIGAFRAVINPEFLLNHNYSAKEAFTITYKILLNAILSDKGKILLKKLKLPQ
jgi:AcrR family transcriptional regulator